MGHRNLLCTSQMIDLEPDPQAQSHVRPESSVLFRSIANFPQANVHTILPAAVSNNIDIHNMVDSHGNALVYGLPQYNGIQHNHPSRNHDSGFAIDPSCYNPYALPNGTIMYPPPVHQGFHDQLPSSSSGRIIEAPADDYRRSNRFMNGANVSFKRKIAEGIAGSSQFSNASVGPSSAISLLNTQHVEPGATSMDTASFPHTECQGRGNDVPPVMEVGSRRTLRNRSGAIGSDSALAHNSSHMIQAGYSGQAFQTASSPWLNHNGGSGGTLTWSQAPTITYLHGSSPIGVCTELGNMGAQGYQETASNRSSATFMHLPPVHPGHPSLHHQPQPMQDMRGQNFSFHPQATIPSHRLPTNNTPCNGVNPFRDGVEMRPRHMGPGPPTGLRIYQPRQRAFVPAATARQLNLPHLRVLPADEVAMLEIPGYYEVGNPIDHHRDMRLDIDHMSYEELLALGEQIGNVATGLSEETITSHLKTRTYISSTSTMDLKEGAYEDCETDFCVICQTDYKNKENIGTLDCGHEYHVDCVKRWLLIKNTCPICKSSAVTTERRDS